MRKQRNRWLSIIIAITVLVVTGCGGGGNDEFVAVGNNNVQPAPNPQPPPGPPGAVLTVLNNGSGSVSTFLVNTATGALTPAATSTAAVGTAPAEVVTGSTAAQLTTFYCTDQDDSVIRNFSTNTNTGAIGNGSQQPNSVAGAFGLDLDASGNFLYVAGTTQIDGFGVSGGVLTRLAGFPISPPGLVGGWRMKISNNNAFLFVTDDTANQVVGYTINANTGALTLIPGSPFASGLAQTNDLEFSANDSFLYVTSDDGNMNGFAVAAGTGVLTPLGGGLPIAINGGLAGNSCGMLAHNGNLYVSDPSLNSTDAFAIAANGALTRLNGFPIGGGGCGPVLASNNASALAPIYFAGFNTNQILGFIPAAGGALTAAPGSPTAAGANGPASMGIFVR